tara:strand:- start:1564 stop:2727 length:1164 start_codon:yes stop_codon:yes gene_type:complete
MPQRLLSFDLSNFSPQFSMECAMTNLRSAAATVNEFVENLMQKDAQLSIEQATNEHLQHKVQRLEEQVKMLKEQVGVELSHHARYNAVKDEAKKCLDKESLITLLEKSRARAREILVAKTKEQDEKYAKDEALEKELDDVFQKDLNGLRKKHKAQHAAFKLESAKFLSTVPGSGGDKRKAGATGKKGAKGVLKDGPRRPAIPMPRTRFIKEMTPLYNTEKKEAIAKALADNVEGFKFPKLFQWVTEPWKNLDPETKKRKYEDPYEAEKQQRDREDAAMGNKDAKRARKDAKVAPGTAASDSEGAAQSEADKPDSDNNESGDEDGGDGSDNDEDGGNESGADEGDGDGSDDSDNGSNDSDDDDDEGGGDSDDDDAKDNKTNDDENDSD